MNFFARTCWLCFAAIDFQSNPLIAWVMSLEGQRILATLVTATGLWKLVPGGWGRTTPRLFAWIGVSLGMVWLGATSTSLPFHGTGILIWTFSVLAVAGGALMVTERRPFYAAIWFAMVLLCVGGLFLLYGAQFLGVATVAVYAGAIVVTFLFVLMLATPEGDAFYDRLSWGSLPRWLACVAGVGVSAAILWAGDDLAARKEIPGKGGVASAQVDTPSDGTSPANSTVAAQAGPADDRRVSLATFDPDEPEHVAVFGANLFSRQWIAVQLAGVLLTAALIGVVAMALQRPNTPQFAAQLRRAVAASGQMTGRSIHD